MRYPLRRGTRRSSPESSLQLLRGQLAIGRYALGITVPEAESVHGQRLALRPNVDDTGQCEGLEGTVTVDGHQVLLTFTKHSDTLRLRSIFVGFAKSRDLDEVAAEVHRRVPVLKMAAQESPLEASKSFWALPSDSLQTVLIGITEGLWVSRGCVNGL